MLTLTYQKLKSNPLAIQILRFAFIGILASACHFVIVYLLVSSFQFKALIANIFAFFCAFIVSYLGHSLWTFSHIKHEHKLAVRKFFLVASIGFFLNESGYFLLLTYTTLSYLMALLIILFIIPIITFILSKFWAFK